jgi:predicted GIY-YIG superfamily endonuclease
MKRYELIDPTNNEIKYVGETNDIENWYANHRDDDWVKRLRKIYKKPIMNIVEDAVKVIPPPVDEIVYIYTLTDPNTNEVRYVGGSRDVAHRYNNHLFDSTSNKNKVEWVNELKSQNKKPILRIIEQTTKSTWIEREKYWIAQYNNLLNMVNNPDTVQTEGGDIVKENTPPPKNGDIVDIYVPDHREVKRNHTEEHRIKLSNALGHKVVINGVEYRSKLHARKELKLGYNAVIKLME